MKDKIKALEKIRELKEKGILTNEEFIDEKSKILKNEGNNKKIENISNNMEHNNEVAKNIGLKRWQFNIALLFLMIFISLLSQHSSNINDINGIFIIVKIILSIYRFKNLGISGWNSLGLFIPFYNLYLSILLIFYKKPPKNHKFLSKLSLGIGIGMCLFIPLFVIILG